MRGTKQKVYSACYSTSDISLIIFFLVLVVLQLIHEENITGVVSMNEDYELWLFANGEKVSLLPRIL
jgi:hypothetical protein